ncbi:NADH dehydrogenase [ubiquinone] 1 alpha subcomplex subunit 7-like [Ctenocephalides felis]|uniref:NADH dehydrogenase [ubiquinone] 1 alpha subcomplex subunit 7-like n=1 Tax=Ctenocephalides felis TaxID=7515 RepID=UPI000E6E3052|nr:NADH dehydrogenase [ubiquinone] 1 alpha subcomplex subunit 7-like [Ctenocephalides felis]
MTKYAPRDVGPFLQFFRDVLLGRTHVKALRFEPFLATRSPPPPAIPDGPSSKLSANYYVSRDARREVMPPTVLHAQNLLASGEATPKCARTKLPTPGQVYRWD